MGFTLVTAAGRPGPVVADTPGVLTTLARSAGDRTLVVHGDLLDPGFAPAPDAAPEQVVAAAGQAFARHCGVLVGGGTAVLWTDHGALCPLHYGRDAAGNLAVATSAAALVALLGRPAQLHSGPRERGRTGFAGVSAVPPGTLLSLPVAGPGEVAVHTHFQLPAPAEMTPDEAVRTVGAALAAAVASQLSDRDSQLSARDSAGALLSGGVDSSTVAALAARRLGTLRTYTVGTPYGDEFAPARRLAEHVGSEHTELLFTPADLADLLPRMVRLLETWDLGTLHIVAPICFVLDQLRGRESVLLTGYGADLLFAGLGGAGSDAATERETRAGVLATGGSNEFSPAFAEDCRIAIRHPYWTAPMIGTALAVPAALNVRAGTVKWALRQAAEQVVPAEVAHRTKIAIQEGTAMHKMFAAVLGTDDPAAQAGRLREVAGELFAAAPHQTAGHEEAGIDARLVGVAP